MLSSAHQSFAVQAAKVRLYWALDPHHRTHEHLYWIDYFKDRLGKFRSGRELLTAFPELQSIIAAKIAAQPEPPMLFFRHRFQRARWRSRKQFCGLKPLKRGISPARLETIVGDHDTYLHARGLLIAGRLKSIPGTKLDDQSLHADRYSAKGE